MHSEQPPWRLGWAGLQQHPVHPELLTAPLGSARRRGWGAAADARAPVGKAMVATAASAPTASCWLQWLPFQSQQ